MTFTRPDDRETAVLRHIFGGADCARGTWAESITAVSEARPLVTSGKRGLLRVLEGGRAE